MQWRRCGDAGYRHVTVLIAGRSIFLGQHDGHNPRRDAGIGWVGRAHLGLAVVVVDLPEAADAAFVDGAEVVLAMRIVVLGEGVEGADLLSE
jgi:hypothetical protein